jgi:hypothetical protein
VTPLYPQKLALTSPTGGGRSVGIVRSRTKATEFSFSVPTQNLRDIILLKVTAKRSKLSFQIDAFRQLRPSAGILLY